MDQPRGRICDREELDVLFILPPLFVFMERSFPSFPLGLGYLVSYLKERGISSRIYNGDVYQPERHGVGTLQRGMKRVVKAFTGFAYFAKKWSSYYDNVNNISNLG